MRKVRQYTFRKIEICRNCGGTGLIALEGRIKVTDNECLEICDVCEGSGRVDKKTEITIEVESYKEG